MRIIGYIEHPKLKITVFKMDTRLSVKFEIGFLEQTYKFGQQNGLEGLREVRQLIDTDFINGVEQQFKEMEALQTAALARYLPPEAPDEFDVII